MLAETSHRDPGQQQYFRTKNTWLAIVILTILCGHQVYLHNLLLSLKENVHMAS